MISDTRIFFLVAEIFDDTSNKRKRKRKSKATKNKKVKLSDTENQSTEPSNINTETQVVNENKDVKLKNTEDKCVKGENTKTGRKNVGGKKRKRSMSVDPIKSSIIIFFFLKSDNSTNFPCFLKRVYIKLQFWTSYVSEILL